MREVQNIEHFEVTLLIGRKIITNKVITLDLVINNVIFIQQCFILPITNPIILGSDFLDICFAVLDIGDNTITLHCTDYKLTTSLTCNSVHYQYLAKIVILATTEILHILFRKKIQKDTLMYAAIVQHRSKFSLPLSRQTVLPALLQLLVVQCNKYFSNQENHYIANFLGTC